MQGRPGPETADAQDGRGTEGDETRGRTWSGAVVGSRPRGARRAARPEGRGEDDPAGRSGAAAAGDRQESCTKEWPREHWRGGGRVSIAGRAHHPAPRAEDRRRSSSNAGRRFSRHGRGTQKLVEMDKRSGVSTVPDSDDEGPSS